MVFDIYKRGQGKYTRLYSAFAAAVIVAAGCWQLYQKMEAISMGLSRRAEMWIVTMVPAGLFVILSFLIFWLVNKPSVADFMISAEGEMKKVSWSSRKEIAVSTSIVIIVVFVMAVLLGATDLGFATLFPWLLK